MKKFMKAFPIPKDVLGLDYCGMNLRDYFAAKAMQGLMSRVDHVNGDCVTNASPDDVAGYAYGLADAMMKAGKS